MERNNYCPVQLNVSIGNKSDFLPNKEISNYNVTYPLCVYYICLLDLIYRRRINITLREFQTVFVYCMYNIGTYTYILLI